jgi:hypothetical protein
MAFEFIGKSKALSEDGLAKTAESLSVKTQEIWAVLVVETSGCGFLPDRRPQILFERHIFHRLTGGRFDDGDISDPSPGGYGPGGANQYERLARALAKDKVSALKSASWGLGQIMGENFAASGFADVETMVAEMSDSEDAQLAAVASFLKSSRLDIALNIHDWTSFARGYNGPGYAKNNYDARLRGEFQKLSFGPLPDLQLRAAQLYLTFAGFHPGPVDGVMGALTRGALIEFQRQQNLNVTGDGDEPTLIALQPKID